MQSKAMSRKKQGGMAMQRRGRVRATTPSHAQAFLGMAAAALLLVAVASDAFVTAVQPSVVQKPGPVSVVLKRASRAPAQEQATGLLRTTAATALLCLAVTSARRGSKASPKVRVHAVMCNSAARTTVEAKAPASQVTEQVALLDLEVCQENLPAMPVMTPITVDQTKAAIAAPVSMVSNPREITAEKYTTKFNALVITKVSCLMLST
eukprot:s3706_g3.t1